jgi:GNAT superfamily N-acetyltransferase
LPRTVEDVRLEPFDPESHADLVAEWLQRPHVAEWWGDPRAEPGRGATASTPACAHDAVCEIEHLWVAPEEMGRGIGRRLLEDAVRYAARIGAAELRIVSDPNAVGFYRRAGARLAGAVDSVPPGRRLPVLTLDVALIESRRSTDTST